MSHYQLPVVIDNGSGVIKAGLAGSREPQFVYPNIIGRPKGQGGGAKGAVEVCVGDQAQERRNALSIRYGLLPAGRTPGGRGGERGSPGEGAQGCEPKAVGGQESLSRLVQPTNLQGCETPKE